MKKLLILCMIVLFSCKTENDKLTIEFNPNIATYSIVERIVADHNDWLFYIDGKREYAYIPMVKTAFDKLKSKDNSSIIKSTLKYLSIIGNQQDLTYQALVRSKKFPQKGFEYSLEDLNLKEEKLKAVENYIQDLKEFYTENNLEVFFEEHHDFLKGGINEFKNNVPYKYTDKMEKYYGQSFDKFIVYPDAFNTVPMSENDSDFFHGNGQKIYSKKGNIATMITSPFLPINSKRQPNEFGFNHSDYVKFIVTHEFGHSFVNHTLNSVKSLLINTENLFYSGLSEKMQPQGYGNWETCIAEHLVRLGEIRIAETNDQKERAEELRNMHVNDFSFVLIPLLEKKIIEYENNRKAYATYKDFLPELLSVLNDLTPNQLRKLLGLPTEMYSTIITLKVPNKEDEVFIVGNQSVLGNWDPAKIKMTNSSDFVRSIKLDLYSDTKLKFTKGSWETEGNIENFKDGQNIEITIKNDSIYNFEIRNWKK